MLWKTRRESLDRDGNRSFQVGDSMESEIKVGCFSVLDGASQSLGHSLGSGCCHLNASSKGSAGAEEAGVVLFWIF